MPETAKPKTTKAKTPGKAAKPRSLKGTNQGLPAECRIDAVVAVTDHGPEGSATLHLSTGLRIQVPGLVADLAALIFGGDK